MSTPEVDIARAAFDAYVRKDRAAMEALVADDFHFTSPLDHRIDRATYFDRCWPNNEWIAAFTFVRLVGSGEEVLVTYECRTNDARTFRNTEVITVREGKIAEVEVYFGWSIPHEAPPGGFVNG